MEQYTPLESLDGESISLELKPCPICNRKFSSSTYIKHVGICSTTASKKRKIFDSSRQRREGTELASYLPKNFGLPASKVEKQMSPRLTETVYPIKNEEIKIKQKNFTSPTLSDFSQGKSRISKRTQPLPSEQCPHCERFFGIKAYDRHVEWCKEKAIQQAIKNPEGSNAAKDRLHARTKYKAPCLRSKRTITRGKYSPSEIPEDDEPICQKPTTLSLSSSIISNDGSFLDTYDPFTSAQRQLKELCSPTPSTDAIFEKSTLTPIQKHLPDSKVTLDKEKLIFRRTLSLRSPRKTSLIPSRPVFLSTNSYRPTVQRGLSDEGPISASFLKSEEFDEIPVRSVCQNDFAITNSDRITRKPSSASSRQEFSKRSLQLILQNDDDGCNNTSKEKVSDRIIRKNDSLTTFLKYEQETESKNSDNSLTAKDLKDKSNILSQKNNSKELVIEKLPIPEKEDNFVRLESISKLPEVIPSATFPFEIETTELIDNLTANLTKMSETDSFSDSSNHAIKQLLPNSSNRNLADGKNFRKRKIILNKNQFLFDATPDQKSLHSPSVESSDEIDFSPKFLQFDNFDVHKFFANFNSDERNTALFKDCQDFFSNHLNSKQNIPSNDFLLIRKQDESFDNTKDQNEIFDDNTEDTKKGEIFISIETVNSENDFEHPAKNNPLADNPTTHILNDFTDKFLKIKDENDKVKLNNIKNLQEQNNYLSAHDGENNKHEEKNGSISRQHFPAILPINNDQIFRTRPATAANPEMMFQTKCTNKDENIPKLYQTTTSLSKDLSSGSSEHSFPSINLSRKEIEMSMSRKTAKFPATGKLSKFCHECGNKFIVETARFCMECGVKRIVL